MTGADFFKDYASPIAWCVAALGWWVSNLQANNRERRKEVRSEIEDIDGVLTSLNEAVSIYYKFKAAPIERASDPANWADCGFVGIKRPPLTAAELAAARWTDCGAGPIKAGAGLPAPLAPIHSMGNGSQAVSNSDEEERKDAALQIKAILREVAAREQRLTARRWSYPSQQYFKDASATWAKIFDTVTGDYFETSKAFESAEAANTLVLTAKADCLKYVQQLHAAALANFDYFVIRWQMQP